MSLEQALQENTAALKAHTAVLSAFGSKTPAPAFIAKEVAAAEAKAEKPVDGPKPPVTKPAAEVAKPATAAKPAKPAASQHGTKALDAATGGPSYDAVKKATLDLVQLKGREAAVTILTKFGVAEGGTAKDLTPDQYVDYMADVAAASAPAEEELA